MASRKLTDAFVRKTVLPSKQVRQLEIWDTEAPGLSLRIGYGGKRSFYVTVRVKGKTRRRYKLGDHPELTLLEARDQTREARANARKGIDPREHERELVREAERARLNTFGAVAEDFITNHAKKRRKAHGGSCKGRSIRTLLNGRICRYRTSPEKMSKTYSTKRQRTRRSPRIDFSH